MTSTQYRRANGVVYPVLVVILGYIVFSLVAFLIASPDAVTWRTWLQIVGAVVALAVSTVFFITKRELKACAIGMLASTSMAYFIIRLFGTTDDSFGYCFPILFAAMIYLNKRIVIIGNAVIFMANVLRLLINFGTVLSGDGSSLVVNIFIMILAAFASIRVTMLLTKFNEENMDEIEKRAALQQQVTAAGSLVADNITKHFNEAMGMMNTLTESISTSSFSMSNIADSTESTAEAIQRQAIMCQNISEHAEQGGVVTRTMTDASTRVEDSVSQGVVLVNDLKQQADNVAEASVIVEEVINELTNKVHEVESFVSTIIGISSQTNLLALNASIEAARAGEAGRGFAVVAEEIRKLSEDTQAASNNITNIISALNVDTARANESIQNSVASVRKQNELIEDTKGKFDEVENLVNELVANINHMSSIMQETVEASGVIADNISQLSATSEQVASSSNEGLEQSQITVTEVEKCKEIFESIYILAED